MVSGGGGRADVLQGETTLSETAFVGFTGAPDLIGTPPLAYVAKLSNNDGLQGNFFRTDERYVRMIVNYDTVVRQPLVVENGNGRVIYAGLDRLRITGAIVSGDRVTLPSEGGGGGATLHTATGDHGSNALQTQEHTFPAADNQIGTVTFTPGATDSRIALSVSFDVRTDTSQSVDDVGVRYALYRGTTRLGDIHETYLDVSDGTIQNWKQSLSFSHVETVTSTAEVTYAFHAQRLLPSGGVSHPVHIEEWTLTAVDYSGSAGSGGGTGTGTVDATARAAAATAQTAAATAQTAAGTAQTAAAAAQTTADAATTPTEARALIADWAEEGNTDRLPDAKEPVVVSQANAEAGTATTIQSWTAQRVGQAIAALAPAGSGGGLTTVETQTPVSGAGTAASPVTIADGAIQEAKLSDSVRNQLGAAALVSDLTYAVNNTATGVDPVESAHAGNIYRALEDLVVHRARLFLNISTGTKVLAGRIVKLSRNADEDFRRGNNAYTYARTRSYPSGTFVPNDGFFNTTTFGTGEHTVEMIFDGGSRLAQGEYFYAGVQITTSGQTYLLGASGAAENSHIGNGDFPHTTIEYEGKGNPGSNSPTTTHNFFLNGTYALRMEIDYEVAAGGTLLTGREEGTAVYTGAPDIDCQGGGITCTEDTTNNRFRITVPTQSAGGLTFTDTDNGKLLVVEGGAAVARTPSMIGPEWARSPVLPTNPDSANTSTALTSVIRFNCEHDMDESQRQGQRWALWPRPL